MFKPRIRVKPGQKFGVVEHINPDVRAVLWRCGCGEKAHNLMEDGTIQCARCTRLFDGTWTDGRGK